jgi:hypothetical protein
MPWRGITADPTLGRELQRFSDAVRQRFGEDAVRAMLRNPGKTIQAPSVAREHRDALPVVGGIIHALKEGEHASAREDRAERLAQHQALGRRPGLRR